MTPIYQCPRCNRKLRTPAGVTATECPYCGSPLEDAGAGRRGETLSIAPVTGEEVADAPAREPAGREVAGAAGSGLFFWLTLTGSVAAVLAVCGIVASVMAGALWPPVARPAASLVVSFLVLVLAALLGRGWPAGRLSRRVLALLGLLLCLVVLVEAAIRMGIYAAGEFPAIRLPGLQVLRGFVGLAGVLIFVAFLKGRSWARRSVAASFCALLVLGAVRLGAAYGVPLLVQGVEPGFGLPEAGLLLAVLLGGVGLASAFLGAVRRGFSVRVHLPWAVFSFVIMVVAAALFCYRLGELVQWQRAGVWLVVFSLGSVCAGLLPVVLIGVISAWRSRGGLREDALGCARFGWSLAVPGVVALLALWLPTALCLGRFELWVLVGGLVSLLLAAWAGVRPKSWIARWALAPGVVGATVVLCGLASLRARFVAGGPVLAGMLGEAAATFLWCVLVIPAILAVGGLAAALRQEQRPSGLRADSHLIHTPGWTLSAVLLMLCYFARAGKPEVAQSIRNALGGLGGGFSDVLEVIAGPAITGVISGAFERLSDIIFAGWWLSFSAVVLALLLVLAVHLGSSAGSRWCTYVVVVLWAAATVAGACLALLLTARLFWQPEPVTVGTPVGRLLAGRLEARLLLLALLVGLVWRFSDALRAVGHEVRGGGEVRRPKSGATGVRRRETHFAQLMNLGMFACAAGLVLALVLGLSVSAEAVLFQLEKFADRLTETLALLAARAGIFSMYWKGWAFCVGAILFMLVALHEETRRGLVSAYPWVAAVWTALLAWLGVVGWRQVQASSWPVPEGKQFVLVALGFVWLVLVITVLALWRRWWLLLRRKRQRGGVNPRGVSSSARSLGSLGLCLSLALAGMVLYSALSCSPACVGTLRRMEAGLSSGASSVALFIGELKLRLEGSKVLEAGAMALGGFSLALLILHFAAQYGFKWAGVATTALWSGVLVFSIGLFGHATNFGTLGQWEAGEVLTVLVLGAAVLAVMSATVSSWLTLLGPAQSQRGSR